MKRDDRIEARTIANHWNDYVYDTSDHPIYPTMEGAAGFAIAHALCAVAAAIRDNAAAIREVIAAVPDTPVTLDEYPK